MSPNKFKTGLRAEIIGAGFEDRLVNVYDTAAGLTAIEFLRPISEELLAWLKMRFKGGVTLHGETVVTINSPAQ